MSKLIFIGVFFAALAAVTIAQTQCLPHLRAVYDVKAYFNLTSNFSICNLTTAGQERLARAITVRLFNSSTDLPSTCSASLHEDGVKCKGEKAKTKAKTKKTKSRDKKNKKGKGDKLEFDVSITCSDIGSDPCLLTNASLSTIERDFRSLLEPFQPPSMQTLTLNGNSTNVSIKRGRRVKVERFCQVASTLEDKTKKGRKPKICSELQAKPFNQ